MGMFTKAAGIITKIRNMTRPKLKVSRVSSFFKSKWDADKR
jgi:hypothetical protein